MKWLPGLCTAHVHVLRSVGVNGPSTRSVYISHSASNWDNAWFGIRGKDINFNSAQSLLPDKPHEAWQCSHTALPRSAVPLSLCEDASTLASGMESEKKKMYPDHANPLNHGMHITANKKSVHIWPDGRDLGWEQICPCALWILALENLLGYRKQRWRFNIIVCFYNFLQCNVMLYHKSFVTYLWVVGTVYQYR